MPKAIVTLTTDFGTSDHFVGVMKGILIARQPLAQLIDITHEISPYEVTEAAFTIAQTYPYFPSKTVHLVVVDPGVGSTRRPILVEAAGQFFVGPDNGVFTMVLAREKKHKIREITAARYFRQPVSNTFHGRDIFAPAAAQLAKGTPPAKLGRVITDPFRLANLDTPHRLSKRAWTGTILKVDRFGNLITNLHIDEFPDMAGRPVEFTVGMEKIYLLSKTYADSAAGTVVLVVGSSGYLEVAVNQASAARKLGCGAGAPVELTLL